MPLYVTNGKLQLGDGGGLAAQRACCCNEEGDDPGDCFCPDFCIYQMQLLSPLQSPRFPQQICEFETFFQVGDREIDFTDSVPELLPSINQTPATAIEYRSENFEFRADRFVPYMSLLYSTNFRAEKTTTYNIVPGVNQSFLTTQSTVSVRFYCLSSVPESAVVQHALEVLLACEARVEQTDVIDEDGSLLLGDAALRLSGAIRYVKRSLYFLDSGECRTDSDRNCATADPEFGSKRKSYAATPLEIEVDLDDTSLGPWQEVDEFIDGEISSLAQPGFDAQAAFSFPVTLRITQRPSCKVFDCNCSTNIDGLKARFEGKEFILGTPHTITEGNTRWQHEQNIAGAYLFFKDTFLAENVECGIGEFSVPIELNTLELYCVTDSEADPPVQRWVVEATTYCVPTGVVDCDLIPLGYAQRLFNAHIPCYEADGGCTGPPGGSYIPLGQPIDVVEAEGSPFLNGDLPDCGAPGFPSFSIEQDCGS